MTDTSGTATLVPPTPSGTVLPGDATWTPPSWDDVVRDHADRVYRLAYRLPGGGPEPEQVFSDTHLDPVLQAALDELAPEFRAAVVLCDVEGLSYEEIGATLGVKLGTVRSRIHRGRAALRSSLERRRAASADVTVP